jgi:hypothetical protein
MFGLSLIRRLYLVYKTRVTPSCLLDVLLGLVISYLRPSIFQGRQGVCLGWQKVCLGWQKVSCALFRIRMLWRLRRALSLAGLSKQGSCSIDMLGVFALNLMGRLQAC